MRKILFRGKDPETGKWYEGFYMALSDTTYCFEKDYAAHPDNTKHYIVFDEMTDWGLPNRHLRADVDPTTVGQYTGLNDKNGKRILRGISSNCLHKENLSIPISVTLNMTNRVLLGVFAGRNMIRIGWRECKANILL